MSTAPFLVSLLALTAPLLMGLFSTEISNPGFWWRLKTGCFGPGALYRAGAQVGAGEREPELRQPE